MGNYVHDVGIVLPSFNQAEFLEQAILSLKENQNHANIKIVVMDGGSTDGSREIIEKYADSFDAWQSKPDGGQSAAINAGMKQLDDCEYVMWLNSDDVFDSEDAVAKILACAKAVDAALCYGRSRFIDREGHEIGEYPVPTSDALSAMRSHCAFSQPSVMVKKSVWDEMDGLDRRLAMCMDYDLWVRILEKYSAAYCDDFIGNTRMYGETKSAKGQLRSRLEGIYIQHRSFGKAEFRWLSNTILCEQGMDLASEGVLSKRISQAVAAVRVALRFSYYENRYLAQVERLMEERAGKL